MKPDLQSVTEDITHLCAGHRISIDIIPVWVLREDIHMADYLSELTDVDDDWGIQPHIFQWINNMCGPLAVDRFSASNNAKCSRFNSRFWNPTECEAIDAFAQD